MRKFCRDQRCCGDQTQRAADYWLRGIAHTRWNVAPDMTSSLKRLLLQYQIYRRYPLPPVGAFKNACRIVLRAPSNGEAQTLAQSNAAIEKRKRLRKSPPSDMLPVKLAQTRSVRDPPLWLFDGSLLFRYMELLKLDRHALSKGDPLLFRELQGVCALCRSKQECYQHLTHQIGDVQWNKWQAYCPNLAALVRLSYLQGL
jgi:hypothetical protein